MPCEMLNVANYELAVFTCGNGPGRDDVALTIAGSDGSDIDQWEIIVIKRRRNRPESGAFSPDKPPLQFTLWACVALSTLPIQMQIED